MKRTHLNLALVLIVGGLAAGAYFGREKEEKGPPLTPLKVADVTDIRVEHPNAPAIQLKRENGKWRMLEPVVADVDEVEVNGITTLAELETKLTLDAAQVKPAELKLDPPQYTVTLNGQKLEIGDVEPLNYRRYVRTGGKIVLVDDPPSAALDQDHSDLVAKTVIPAGAQIARVVLPKLTVERSADDKGWALTPDDPSAGADQRQKFIDAWTSARALWMAKEPDEGSKGDAVTVVLKDGRELHFIVAATDPQLMLARPDFKVRYTLSKALADEILRIPAPPAPAAAADDARTGLATDEPVSNE